MRDVRLRIWIVVRRIVGLLVVAPAAMAQSAYENLTPEQIMARSTEEIAPGLYTFGSFGGRQLKLMYFGRNHGDCMLVMQLDGTDVLFVGDLVTPYSVGLGFFPDYYPGDYVRSLKEIEALPGWSRMIGNHGIPVAPKEALVQRRRYLEALMDAVRGELERNELQGDALYQSIELPEEFRQMRGYSRNIARAAERIAYYYGMGW